MDGFSSEYECQFPRQPWVGGDEIENGFQLGHEDALVGRTQDEAGGVHCLGQGRAPRPGLQIQTGALLEETSFCR